ncbi:MAG: methylamine utilization protein [Gammaproteobacteria bacterium]|nr:MAG: methylamine utilization protein [Gammaproteobacteria bacterium]
MPPRRSGWIVAALAALLARGAAAVTVSIIDETGTPVSAMAVVLTALAGDPAPPVVGTPPYVVDQVGLAFSPKVLVIPAGAQVRFPNSDTVSHHVYSFSRPNNFELPLYKGTQPAPIRFDSPGLVTMGCNIHDHMLGYVIVVASPHVATTNIDGIAVIDNVPAGEYQLSIVHTETRDPNLQVVDTFILDGSAETVVYRLSDGATTPNDDSAGSLSWDEY